jgi:hypothetical protein
LDGKRRKERLDRDRVVVTNDRKGGAQIVQPEILHFEGIGAPLPAEQRRRFEAAEDDDLDMSTDAVLTAARARTDLDDFGSLDFEARLERLLAEVARDDNVWKLAKASFTERCVRAATERLCVHDYLTHHPEVDQQTVDRPLFVVGLPRSGTTHLENLIAADRRLRYLPVYLGAEPVPVPGELLGPGGRDPRWERADARWQTIVSSNRVLAAMHEHSPDHACSDNELQMSDFASYQWEWLADVPQWRDSYLAEDQSPHYEYGRRLLQAIMVQFPGYQRWLLKSNQHNEQLVPLMKVYPDATVVMIHRDPVAIVQSVLTMRGMTLSTTQREPDVQAHVEYWVDRIERMLRAYLRDIDVVPAERRVDLMFHDVMADDVGAVATVFEHAGLPVTDESTADLEAYLADHQRSRSGRVVYDLQGDFELEPDALRERFQFYFERFPVKAEV